MDKLLNRYTTGTGICTSKRYEGVFHTFFSSMWPIDALTIAASCCARKSLAILRFSTRRYYLRNPLISIIFGFPILAFIAFIFCQASYSFWSIQNTKVSQQQSHLFGIKRVFVDTLRLPFFCDPSGWLKTSWIIMPRRIRYTILYTLPNTLHRTELSRTII